MAYPYYQPMYYQQQQPAQRIIWVGNQFEAQSYPVAPNNAVALWEQNGKTIYLKSADATGKPTMRIYDIVERVENPEKDTPIYVTKEELTEILSVMKGLTGEVEQIKGDLYGISGRKRKKEVVEDDE